MNRLSRHAAFSLALAAILCGSLVTHTLPATAQEEPATEQAQETPGALFLKVVSSHTGLAVRDLHIEADGVAIQPAAAEGGLMVLILPTGQHRLGIAADDHAPLQLDVTVEAADTPVMEIELDPENPVEPPQIDANTAILRGTVADVDTAEPIDGARLKIAGSALTAQTTATGEFRLEIKTGSASADNRPAVTLEVEAADYKALRLANIPLAPGSEARIPVQLSRPTSATEHLDRVEVDHWTSPGSNFISDWAFDVTIR